MRFRFLHREHREAQEEGRGENHIRCGAHKATRSINKSTKRVE